MRAAGPGAAGLSSLSGLLRRMDFNCGGAYGRDDGPQTPGAHLRERAYARIVADGTKEWERVHPKPVDPNAAAAAPES